MPEKIADEKDKEVSVSLLKIQVGLIRKAWKHPSADRYNYFFPSVLLTSLPPPLVLLFFPMNYFPVTTLG